MRAWVFFIDSWTKGPTTMLFDSKDKAIREAVEWGVDGLRLEALKRRGETTINEDEDQPTLVKIYQEEIK